MKKFLALAIMLTAATLVKAQHIKAYSMDDVLRRTSSNDTVYIVNFWATWCIPCVQELPEFNELCMQYKSKPVKILLVSLDFKEDYPLRLERFVEKKKLQPEIAWLSDTDPNQFIPKIADAWEGSIPATVIIQSRKHYKKFIEGAITRQQVNKEVDLLLQ